MEEVSAHLPHANTVPVQRKHFNESRGLSLLQQLVTSEARSNDLQYSNKFYCLAAASALLKYLEYSEAVTFRSNSIRVDFQAADKCTVVDPETAEHIELMTSLGNDKTGLSLFSCLNKCTTRGGLGCYQRIVYNTYLTKSRLKNGVLSKNFIKISA